MTVIVASCHILVKQEAQFLFFLCVVRDNSAHTLLEGHLLEGQCKYK